MKQTSKLLICAMTMACSVVTALAGTATESIFHPVSSGIYPDNMTMVIRLTDGDAALDNYEVAAFVDGECRGATWADEDDGLYYLIIAGEGSGQPMEIRGAVDGEVMVLCSTLTYSSDGNMGTPWEPFVIDVRNADTAYTPGDVNGDGIVNAADIVEVVNYIMGNPSDKFNKRGADVNEDGNVNAADIVRITTMILSAQ